MARKLPRGRVRGRNSFTATSLYRSPVRCRWYSQWGILSQHATVSHPVMSTICRNLSQFLFPPFSRKSAVFENPFKGLPLTIFHNCCREKKNFVNPGSYHESPNIPWISRHVTWYTQGSYICHVLSMDWFIIKFQCSESPLLASFDYPR